MKAKNPFYIKRLIVAVIFTVIVIILTHLPQGATPPQLQAKGFDKLGHVIAYGAMAFLFILSLKTTSIPLSVWLLFFALLAVASIDELTQLLSNRTASLTDWLANIIGIVATLLLYICSETFKR